MCPYLLYPLGNHVQHEFIPSLSFAVLRGSIVPTKRAVDTVRIVLGLPFIDSKAEQLQK